jgi:hypothetical protein
VNRAERRGILEKGILEKRILEKEILEKEILEKLEAYVASELSDEEARKLERLVHEDPEALRLAGFYLRRLAMLGIDRGEPPGVPEAENGHASRRANGGHSEERNEYFPRAKRRGVFLYE